MQYQLEKNDDLVQEVMVCNCLTPAHYICFTLVRYNEDGPPEFCCDIKLNPNHSLFKRIVSAVKYVFGFPLNNKGYHYENVYFNKQQVNKLKEMIRIFEEESVGE